MKELYSEDYLRELLATSKDLKQQLAQITTTWYKRYLFGMFDARELLYTLPTNIISSLLSSLPNAIYLGNTTRAIKTLAHELQELTNNIFDGTTLIEFAALGTLAGRTNDDPILVSEIFASLNYAIDIVTISQAVLGSPLPTWHKHIDQKLINDFQSKGGLELVEALYNGITVEDIIGNIN